MNVSSPKSQLLDEAIPRFTKQFFASGCSLPSTPSSKLLTQLIVSIEVDESMKLESASEDYSLTVPSDGSPALINAKTAIGALRALETFSQLISPNTDIPIHLLQLPLGACSPSIVSAPSYIPGFTIKNAPWSIQDSPRFSYRGLLLDTSRNYYPVKKILEILDIMSFTKLNVFHWHIVDSHSFPLQSEAIKSLSEKGAYSQWEIYTKEDVTIVINYARSRGIRVIPEFDMPGHTFSWGIGNEDLVVCGNKQPWTKYCNEPPCGQLDITKDSTFKLVSELLNEQARWFEDPYMHLGHDEINIPCYEDDKGTKEYMKANNMNVSQLIGGFTAKVTNLASSLNKTSMFWDEVVLTYNVTVPKEKTVIQVWTGLENVKKVVDKGYQVVVSPYTPWYLDCGRGNWLSGLQSWCPYNSWQDAYQYDPTAGIDDASKKLVLGGSVAMWSEIADTNTVTSLIFPRAAAAAESLWSSPGDWNEAIYRLDRWRQLVSVRGYVSGTIWPAFCKNGDCVERKS
ncbi:glycoside hydrolase superfamily [Globomyces pollinis-pini]|nr:glycoside hydrolase superfamily [Globomyces pollinis-pini]